MIITTSIGTSEEDVECLVAAMDVDGDGKVTYQEYLNSFRWAADYAYTYANYAEYAYMHIC